MDSALRPHAFVWSALVTLTLFSFVVGEGLGIRALPGAILLVAAGKGLLLAWRFMELRTAHAVWRMTFVGAWLLLIGGLLLLLVRR